MRISERHKQTFKKEYFYRVQICAVWQARWRESRTQKRSFGDSLFCDLYSYFVAVARIIQVKQQLAVIKQVCGLKKCFDKINAPAYIIYSAVSDDSMNFCKFMVCIDIFEEKGLIETDRFNMTARLVEGAARVDIETSEILKALRAGKSDIYAAVRKNN